jgi:preprotein translocase subunit SecD
MVYYSKLKMMLVLAACLLSIIFAVPSFLGQKVADSIPRFLPHKTVSLGLDLQGGSHLLFEVGFDAVMKERLDNMVDSIREVLRKERVRYTNLGIQGNSVGVTINEPDKVDTIAAELRKLDSTGAVASQSSSGGGLLGGSAIGAASDTTQTVNPGGRIVVALTDRAIRDRRTAAVQQSIEIVRRRIDETGVREPTIQREGEDRILVQLPGYDDPDRIKEIIGKTAKMTFHLVDDKGNINEAMAGRVPPGMMLLPSVERTGAQGQPQFYLVEKRVMVAGDSLIDAQPSFDQRSSEPVVSFRFDTIGARHFGEATRNNVGRLFAIVLDNKVISAPVIREPILGGSGQISGSFTTQSAADLALLLRAGALPAPLNVIEERTVGPGLGADSIRAGIIASIVGSILVVAFMVAAYGLFGLFANMALVINVFMILAFMSLLQATLTLPGIAGIVLTIGMAVDANVLIYERIREEVRAGRTPISAIDAGFSRAFATILDSHVTTLTAALLLYIFGSGPVRGFAVTLGIGILASLFTSIMVTRLIVIVWLQRKRPQVLPL